MFVWCTQKTLPFFNRWGIASGITADKQVEAILDEIDKCHLFLGFLGERYGWKPQIPLNKNVQLSRRLEARGCADLDSLLAAGEVSITELEMKYAALMKSTSLGKGDAFFFLRDHNNLATQLPIGYGSM